MTAPAVSVVVPAYNAERFIAQTLQSVQAQTLRSWECIVVDDGSTDSTRQVVESILTADTRIRYRFQPNRGLAAARNAGLADAAGRYVQFLDADDLIAPSKLAVQVQVLDEDEALGVSYTNYRLLDDATGMLRDPFWPDMLGDNPLEDLLFRWERGLSIPIHTALFRRALWEGREAFDESLRAKEDWLMWIDLALRGVRFKFDDEDLAFYRLHSRNLHRSPSMKFVFLRAAFVILERLPPALRERFVLESARHVVGSAADEQVRQLERERDVAVAEVERRRRPSEDVRRAERSSARPVAAGCSIISRNYLSHARVLSQSFLAHHPDAHFYVLVVDGLPEGEAVGSDVRVVSPEELGIPYLSELVMKYELVELCTALKPALLSFVLSAGVAETAVFLDPDILVCRSFAEVGAALEFADIVLTPHVLSPMPLDGRRPDELEILNAGVFNLGFVAVRRSVETGRFLQWWSDRLRNGCYKNFSIGQYVDQKWVDFVPIYFSPVHILRDDTYNVAYWNLQSRRLEHAGDQFTVNGRPLAFFHFSGIDFRKGSFSPRHQDRHAITTGSPLAALVALYARAQQRNGNELCRQWRSGLYEFDNGQPFNRILRELYARLPAEVRSRFGDPRQTSREGSFFRWALSADANGLSPFLEYVYSLRPDVAAAYLDVAGVDRQRFLDWASTSGAREMGYDPALVSLTGLQEPEDAPGSRS